jgi:hypothetical protein
MGKYLSAWAVLGCVLILIVFALILLSVVLYFGFAQFTGG